MHFFPEYLGIFSSVTPDTLILTPNQRLSRFVKTQFNLWLESQNLLTWSSLNCLSMNQWLQVQWEELQLTGNSPETCRLIMNPAQEQAIWLQSIDESSLKNLLSSESMAELSMQAWKHLRLWNKSLNELSQDIEETSAFKVWVEAYQQNCKNKFLLDATESKIILMDAFIKGSLPIPAHLICFGFDEFSPLERDMFNVFEKAGANLSFKDLKLSASNRRIQLSDRRSEIYSMAKWAATLLSSDPEVSIGLVVPDLANIRPTIERIFSDIFEPQYKLPNQLRHAAGFNISAAQPLVQTPLIGSALSALQLNRKEIDRDTLSRILTTRFLSTVQERRVLVRVSRDLTENCISIPTSKLNTVVGRYSAAGLGDFSKRLNQFHQIAQSCKYQELVCSEWAKIFAQQIQVLGWPGSADLDTLEFQQLQHWPELLANLSSLDRVLPAVSLNRALSEIKKLAYTPFHHQTKDSPVQILGLLEAAGMQFDYLWVMGLDHRAWPEACSPNPLISPAQQRAWGMPRSSSDKELALATRLTKRLSTSAYHVIFSSPLMDADQPLRASPLITDIPLINSNDIELYEEDNYLSLLKGQPLLELNDETGPPLLTVAELRGGVQILKNQAACPFRAFSKHRLYAENSEMLQMGVSPLLRGNLIHRALEFVWNQLKTQKELLNSSPEILAALIENAVESAWQDMKPVNHIGFHMRHIESLRAQKLIAEWLKIERARKPFRVKWQEVSTVFRVANIPLSIRYDRMDEIEETGEVCVLDYKTGSVDVKSWAGERPDDPQVPLYCLSLQGHAIAAAVLAQINVKQVAAKGIAESAEVIPGLSVPSELARLDLPNSWDEILQYWTLNLEKLAEAFVAGDAKVDPKSKNSTCTYCDLKSLCRIGFVEAEAS